MYQSPIEVIYKEMRTEFENNVYKAIQDYGVCVDKDELIKALQYDRGQYEKGYADGLLHQKDEWISVDERLPEEEGNTVLYYDGTNVDACLFYFGHFHTIDLYESDRIDGVTHWMPLPTPPMMKGGAG